MNRATATPSPFSLSKWYLDCVDTRGNVFIGYSAVLKWKKIRLNYANILDYNSDRGIQTATSLLRLPSPLFNHHSLIKWSPSRLKISGQWEGIDTPIQKILLNSDAGAPLSWLCYQPKAKAEILLPGQQVRAGLGYAEKLEMSVKPWKLPLAELRWGRFLSESDTIVWINWQGEMPVNWVFYQGNPVSQAIVGDDFVSINRGEILLQFSDSLVLREGPLISTALSGIPGIRDLFPAKILNTYECKWRSKGTLIKPNRKTSQGWIIHEVVKWETKPA